MEIQPESISFDIATTVLLSERSKLPSIKAVYFILDSKQKVLYIGNTSNLLNRWRNHHHLENFLKIDECRISWIVIDDSMLGEEIEDACIQHFLPPWNKPPKKLDKASVQNALRQQRYRERRKAQEPKIHYQRPKDRRSKPQRWAEAVQTLRGLQEAYQEWLDNLPESLQDTALAEKLQEVCDIDLDVLDVELPKGFGRD